MAIASNSHEQDSESDYDDVLDSDEELQKAFERGDLPPGTYKEINKREKIPNDVPGMELKLKSLMKPDESWVERLEFTVEPESGAPGTPEVKDEEIMQDDFKRELYFYRLAQAAVLQGIPKLHRLGIPTKRPEDYFAQMVKSDDHMKKVREKLLSRSIAAERSEKAKAIRELKKMGKKVQQEVLKGRQKQKKETLEAIKKYRKGQQDRLDFLEGDGVMKQKNSKTPKSNPDRMNKKREWKNKKFGFGGQKKRSKSNNKESYNDSRDFSVAKNKKGYKPATKGKKNARPGKSKRQQMKAKKR